MRRLPSGVAPDSVREPISVLAAFPPAVPAAPAGSAASAVSAAYVAGVLLVLSGGTGAVGLVSLGSAVVATLSPEIGHLLAPLFLGAYVLAAGGGFTVLLGARALHRGQRGLGRFLLGLGSGVGLLGLAANLAAVGLAGGNPVRDLMETAASVHGAGVLLAVYAQWRS